MRLLRKLPIVALFALSVSTLVSTVAGAFNTFGRGSWVIGVLVGSGFALAGSIELIVRGPLPIRRYLPRSKRRSVALALRLARSGASVVILLDCLWCEADDFLDLPPDRHYYDNWLRRAAAQISQYSPQLAAEWGAPEPARAAPHDAVSIKVIQQRLDRIETLHRRVAEDGVPLRELVSAGFPGADAATMSRA